MSLDDWRRELELTDAAIRTALPDLSRYIRTSVNEKGNVDNGLACEHDPGLHRKES
jgi:hypothetical protein